MIYSEHIPSLQLTQFVEKIWYCKAHSFASSSITIPFLHHELVFNFSDSYCIHKIGTPNDTLKNPRTWINGLHTKAYHTFCSGKHEMLGILFKPDGLKSFLPFHLQEFTEKTIDASLVFGNVINDVREQIQNARTVLEKIILLENFLLRNFSPSKQPPYLSYALEHLSNPGDSRVRITTLCKQLAISNKSLIHCFKKHIGVSPVTYIQLQLTNKALMRLSKNSAQSLTRLAYSLNFYDQSHFNHLFKSITTLTPSQYTAFVQTGQLDDSSPNFIQLKG